MVYLKKYTYNNASYRLSLDILSNITLSHNTKQLEREKNFIKYICKRVQTSSSVLYILKSQNDTLGFIALSVSSIGDFPSLQIDYIFVNYNFRGKQIKALDNLKTSTYLIEFAIEIAKEIQTSVGLRYLVLLPDNEKLHTIYTDMGFSTLPKQQWLYIKL